MNLSNDQIREIEALWIAGVLSIRAIASKYDVSDTAIRKMAKAKSWPERGTGRTVSEIAQDKARLLPVHVPADLDKAIEELSDLGADIIQHHRKDLALLRMIVMDHAREVQYAYTHREHIEDRLMEYFTAKGALSPLQAETYRNQLNAALSTLTTGSRSKTALSLTQAYEKLVAMERTNFKLDEADDGEESYEKLLKEIHDAVTNGEEDRRPEMPATEKRGNLLVA
jgi:hypothetical protein